MYSKNFEEYKHVFLEQLQSSYEKVGQVFWNLALRSFTDKKNSLISTKLYWACTMNT